jgi:hypothetical protein
MVHPEAMHGEDRLSTLNIFNEQSHTANSRWYSSMTVCSRLPNLQMKSQQKYKMSSNASDFNRFTGTVNKAEFWAS